MFFLIFNFYFKKFFRILVFQICNPLFSITNIKVWGIFISCQNDLHFKMEICEKCTISKPTVSNQVTKNLSVWQFGFKMNSLSSFQKCNPLVSMINSYDTGIKLNHQQPPYLKKLAVWGEGIPPITHVLAVRWGLLTTKPEHTPCLHASKKRITMDY